MVNAAGLSTCSFCGGDFGTAVAEQVTAQHIGLELRDGTVEVLFPGGTHYPTEWHRVDTLSVRDDSGGSVRFNIWEGPTCARLSTTSSAVASSTSGPTDSGGTYRSFFRYGSTPTGPST
jgi:hypothetical protein